ncbi:MAG: TldD/PmbA family protein [Deltaproteobacteria bacterium]|nr:MAG: TldD/PmbA family protein [Deltaproteobacteria bacterium]
MRWKSRLFPRKSGRTASSARSFPTATKLPSSSNQEVLVSLSEVYRFVEKELDKLKPDCFELFTLEERVSHVESRDGRVDFARESSSTGFALRVFREGRMGFSYSFSPEKEDLRRMVEGASWGARYAHPDGDAGLPSPPDSYPRVPFRMGPAPAPEEKSRLAVDLERETLARDGRMKRVRYATVREVLRKVRIENSLGLEGEYERSFYTAFVYAVAEEGGQSESGFGVAIRESFSDLVDAVPSVADEASMRALRMLGSRRISTGKYPVIVENGAMVELLEVLVPSFSLKNVLLGRSWLAGKRGERLFSPLVTIQDDPLLPEGTGACPFDDEGVPSRKLDLVREGVVSEFLADTRYGKKGGTGSTGSARRGGVKSPPEVGHSNVIFRPGEESPREMMGKFPRGILLTGFLGLHTADPVSGDFSVGAQGLYFEGGEVAFPVRTFAISGNIFSLLRDVVAVGSDFRLVGSIGAPSVAVSELDIGGE